MKNHTKTVQYPIMTPDIKFVEINSISAPLETRPGGYPECPPKGSRASCQFPMNLNASGEKRVQCTNPAITRGRSNPSPCQFLDRLDKDN